MKAFAVLLVVLTAACTVERHDLAQNDVAADSLPAGDSLLDLRLNTVCRAYGRAAALARVDTLADTAQVDYLLAASVCQGFGHGPVDVPPPVPR